MGAHPPAEILIERRRKVYKSVEAIFGARQASDRHPVEKKEVMLLTGFDRLTAFAALRWLVRHGILLWTGVGYVPNRFEFRELCWLHGLTKKETIDCPICRRKEK